MRYIIYCRKSSESEDKQVMSLDAQDRELNEKAAAMGVEIAAVYHESMSAKSPGRPLFNEVIGLIEKGEADGILCWKLDRLARNFIDGGRIIDLLQRNILKSILTFEKEYQPSDNVLLMAVELGMANQYIRDLSANVLRGNREKIKQGWRPGTAPPGYLNDKETATIIPDPERFPLIRQMFELALTKTYTPPRIWEIARDEWGYTTPKKKRRGGKPIVLSSVQKILRNPFYAGILEYHGKEYQGAHTPVVTLAEFDRVQQILSKRAKPKPIQYTFPFTGSIRCGECGCLVTAEHKVNRHGTRYCYYHCTRRKVSYKCRQPSIQAPDIERQIIEFLTSLAVPTSIHRWMIQKIAKLGTNEQNIHEAKRQSLEKALAATNRQMSTLTSLRTRELIRDEEFISDRTELDAKLLRIEDELRNIDKTDPTFEPFAELISFRNRAVKWFLVGDDEVKRIILQLIGSNPILKDKKLFIVAAKHFLHECNMGNLSLLRAHWYDVRTLYTEKDEELLETLANIKTLKEKLNVN